MIYLVHGENQVDSRRFLLRIKANYQDIQNISGKDLTIRAFREKLNEASGSLFGGKSAFLVENFDGNWQIFPKKIPQGLDVLLWSGKKIELAKTILVKNFLFDKVTKATAFKLADSLLFRDEKDAQILLSGLLATREPNEKIIGAILRGLFLAFCAKDSIDELRVPEFAREKIKEQAKIWSKNSLKKAILELIRADLRLKEGGKSLLVFSDFVSRVSSL